MPLLKNTFLLLNLILWIPSLNAQVYDESVKDLRYVFVAKHQGYTCERWGREGYKDSSLEESGIVIQSLEITKNTRNIRILVNNISKTCEYQAYFSREKGSTEANFLFSSIQGESCQNFLHEIDLLMAGGWNYKLKNLKYLSVQFSTPIVSQCDNLTGESYVRFIYDILGT